MKLKDIAEAKVDLSMKLHTLVSNLKGLKSTEIEVKDPTSSKLKKDGVVVIDSISNEGDKSKIIKAINKNGNMAVISTSKKSLFVSDKVAS